MIRKSVECDRMGFTDGCVLSGGKPTAEPTLTDDRWFLSGTYRKPFTA
jgi:hypothetical protein